MKNNVKAGRKGARLEADSFLRKLGFRVRTMRNRRGMTRKALARYAQISERYLAQLEAGAGNCSIVLLQRIARAMGLPVAELVDDRADRPIEAALLDQFLDRLSPQELREARELVLKRFGGLADDLRRNRIALIGLRGGGKSTLGKMLAKELGVPFVELDREVERLSGTTLSEMFEMFGQETFRRTERLALERVLQEHDRFVLATGGGIVTEPGTFELLISSCFTVWVKAAPGDHMQRVVAQGDLRPMADNRHAMDDLVSILKSREPLYARADLTLVTAGKSPEHSLAELLSLFAAPERQGA
jgi:XRE family aerobic/anaerobic benzoate catabolism transcriptional regulator